MSTIQIPNDYCENDLRPEDIQLVDFLKRTKLPNDDINMILDYIAYCMTVQNTKKAFMCLVGGSNTGKSTLINMLNALIGKHNVSALSIQDMAVRFYPAQLKDKLVNACADNSSIALNDIGNLKKITGNDEIMYEDKGCKPYFFTPFAKLIFSFNALPLQLEERSDAFYERIRILEMNNKIELTQTYVDDLCSPESISAIIPVLCKRLKGMRKIKPSKNSARLTDKLRSESDSIHSFVTSQLEITNSVADYISKDEMYELYSRFCLKDDRAPYKRLNFHSGLGTFGLVEMKDGNRQVYIGVKKR
jgi:P4 family phage/plasmid primase-like protien